MKIVFISTLILSGVQLVITFENDPCIEVFKCKNFNGEKLNVCIESDSKCYNLNDKWNNKVSSINTHNQCVVLYEKHNCKGSYIETFADEEGYHQNLKAISFDNKVSSMSLCTYLNQVGWYSIDRFDFWGSDGFYLKVSNEEECKERCINDHKCKFILKSLNTEECWGKYYGDFSVCKNDKRRAISKNLYKREFIHKRGESYVGRHIIYVANITENECEAICGIHPKCTAANFLQSEGKCFIKNMNHIYIDYDPKMIGIREKDWNCLPFNSSSMISNSTVYKRCSKQNDLWIRDKNKCQDISNDSFFE